jgi:hypothetical protein
MANKRARVAPASEDDVLHFAWMIMENDPFKARAPMELFSVLCKGCT